MSLIIPSGSYLEHPPTFINPQLVLILNAIRYSVKICEISNIRLCKALSDLTENPKVEEYAFPEIYLEAWSIINNAVIFRNILEKHFEIDLKDNLFIEINKARELRNTYQHIDERITEVFIKEDLPIFGSVSWFKRYPESDKAIFCSTYSGSFTNRQMPDVKFSNVIDENLNNQIQKIELASIVRIQHKNPKKEFQKSIVHLSTLIYDLNEIIRNIDLDMKEFYKNLNSTERHLSDFIIKLKGRQIKK